MRKFLRDIDWVIFICLFGVPIFCAGQALVSVASGRLLHATEPPNDPKPVATPLNNASSTLAVDHALGSRTFVLKPGDGTHFSSAFPIRITVARRGTLSN